MKIDFFRDQGQGTGDRGKRNDRSDTAFFRVPGPGSLVPALPLETYP